MKRLHVIGRKNHGKTQLLVELVEQLSARGLRVGTIKHTHHQHELDTPGKDSHRHRIAGSAAVGILSPSMNAVFIPTNPEHVGASDRYAAFGPLFESCDLVLVEGDTQANAPKIEVWRSAVGSRPLAVSDESILAVVTDDAPGVDRMLFARRDLAKLVDWILTDLFR